METTITDDIVVAASFLKAGQLVAFPTETVYGLGADAMNPDAIERIFAAKLRPVDNPVIIHVAFRDRIDRLVTGIPDHATALMDAFFPGPLTLIMNRHPDVPASVSAGLSTVGIRMPAHDAALELIRASDRPIAAPSANLSGRPSPTTWQAVREDLDGSIACILKGGRTEVGLESTVVDCTTLMPRVLRKGWITLEELRAVVPGTDTATGSHADSSASPGMRHRHYAPRARIEIVDDPSEIPFVSGSGTRVAYIGLTPTRRDANLLLSECVADSREYAFRLFEFMRECDRMGIDRIYCQAVEPYGVGTALMDRLERAARG